ncbi:MAG: hypothetical protein KDA68_03915, partial [Planctomycetaceae bacterium]|nr:hypothetical protein [Planctomycetaceae bacterium]
MRDSPILVASGSCEITPGSPIPLFGYAHRRAPYTRIASPLEANAVLLIQEQTRIVILQVDSLFPSSRLKTAVESRLNSNCELLLVASHTHFAPSLDPLKPPLGDFSEEFFSHTVERLSNLINGLLAETPISLDYCRSSASCDAAVFRRKRWLTVKRSFPYLAVTTAMLPNPAVDIDRAVNVVSLFDNEGNPVAILWNWACHPTASPDPLAVSADYIGVVRERIRKAVDRRIPVVFLPGFMGDVRPRILADPPQWNQFFWNPFAPSYFGSPTPESFNRFCDLIASSVIHAIPDAEKHTSLLGRLSLIRKSCPLNRIFELRSSPRESLPIALLHLNDDLKFVFIGAEPSSQYVPGIRRSCGPNTIAVGYYEDVFGYLPTEDQVPEGGYEVKGFQNSFNMDGDFLPGFEEALLE